MYRRVKSLNYTQPSEGTKGGNFLKYQPYKPEILGIGDGFESISLLGNNFMGEISSFICTNHLSILSFARR